MFCRDEQRQSIFRGCIAVGMGVRLEVNGLELDRYPILCRGSTAHRFIAFGGSILEHMGIRMTFRASTMLMSVTVRIKIG